MGSPEEPAQSGQKDQPHIKHHPLTPTFDGTDAPNETELHTLVGFVGDSPRYSFLRVYTDLSLRSYCEVKTSDIVQALPLDPADDQSPTTVRLRADARIEYVRVDRLAGDASFVFGAIRARYLGRFGEREPVRSEEEPIYLKSLDQVQEEGWPGGPQPVTPVLYCVSQVYPPCP